MPFPSRSLRNRSWHLKFIRNPPNRDFESMTSLPGPAPRQHDIIVTSQLPSHDGSGNELDTREHHRHLSVTKTGSLEVLDHKSRIFVGFTVLPPDNFWKTVITLDFATLSREADQVIKTHSHNLQTKHDSNRPILATSNTIGVYGFLLEEF